MDPTKEQWKEISAIMKVCLSASPPYPALTFCLSWPTGEKPPPLLRHGQSFRAPPLCIPPAAQKLILLILHSGQAYQGFATGSVEGDAFAPRYFVQQGHLILLAQSFAKNMGLYGERVGTLSIVAASGEEKAKLESQMKMWVCLPCLRVPRSLVFGRRPRQGWASDTHGCIACFIIPQHRSTNVLEPAGSWRKDRGDHSVRRETLRAVVRHCLSSCLRGTSARIVVGVDVRVRRLTEVKAMADRIIGMRSELYDLLVNELGSKKEWGHIKSQIGYVDFLLFLASIPSRVSCALLTAFPWISMFAFTGLTPDQVAKITADHHVYLTKDGRISVAGKRSSYVRRSR